MPLAIFVAIAVLCQTATVALCLLIERFVASWISVIAFGVLYIVAFGVAWKLTVWLIDSRLQRFAAPR